MREQFEWDWDGSQRKKGQQQQVANDLVTISADIPRTCPSEQQAGRLDAEALRRVLDALAVTTPAESGGWCGYVQGISHAVAFVLSRQPAPAEHECYSMLLRLGRRPLLRLLWSVEPAGWAALSATFGLLLATRLPDLALHLDRLGLLPQMYLPEWLMPLYARCLSPRLVAYVWSVWLVEGDAFLLRAAVAVMRALAPQLLACRELAQCRAALGSAPETIELDELREMLRTDSVLLGADDMEPLARWVPRFFTGASDTK
jgi:hypothetical protein